MALPERPRLSSDKTEKADRADHLPDPPFPPDPKTNILFYLSLFGFDGGN
jgi:hypothetical protein